MNCDFHTHTNFSACANKENSWESLLRMAENIGIDKLSITDHNTCLFHVINKFINTRKYFSGKIIAGMECDVAEDGYAFELLAYNFDVIKTFNWAYQIYGTLETRQSKMKDALVSLVKNIGLKIDENWPFNGKIDYAHKYIYENLSSFDENKSFFEKYKVNSQSDLYRLSTGDKDFPLFLDMNQFWPSVVDVVKAIHGAGGIVVLAHPYNYKGEIDANKLLKLAVSKKLDGIEIIHPSCNKEQSKYLLEFAKKHKMLVTGGSDYHGTGRHNTLGIDDLNKENYQFDI